MDQGSSELLIASATVIAMAIASAIGIAIPSAVVVTISIVLGIAGPCPLPC